MELIPTELSHVESLPQELSDNHLSTIDNNSAPNNESTIELPFSDIIVAKEIKLDSQPEDSQKGQLAKSDPQPENVSQGKLSEVKVIDNKSTENKPVSVNEENRNWKFLAMAMKVLIAVAIGFSAIKLIFQSRAEVFKSPDRISGLTTTQIDEVIRSSVRLDEKVTLEYIRSKLTVSQFKSQDRQYTVFRIIATETCGKLGCLYVIKSPAGMLIPLQLEDIGVGKEMFRSCLKFHCFTVIQQQNGEDRNFEVCERG
jgi:hypothetical protein